MSVTERRIRSGRYEYLCDRTGRWYWNLGAHVHRYHLSACICSDRCKVRRAALLRRLDPLANPKR